MKKFFNSIWFRCISVLLALLVVFGGMLAILNDLLYVSAEERTSRAVKKIYGREVEYTVASEQPIVYEGLGSINKIYKVENDTLLQATGENGYKGGTITLWVKVVTNENDKLIIDKIVLESYEKQTLMSKFDGSYYQGFYQDITTAYKDDTLFTTNGAGEFSNPMTGATKSANAIVNAVNCVIKYFGGENSEN